MEEDEFKFFVVRVAVKQEKVVALMLANKAERLSLPVKSVLFDGKVKGYLIVEAKDEDTVLKLISNMKHVKGMLSQPISKEEVLSLIEKKEEVVEIKVGDLVEIVSGAFKGERAKVTAVDEEKNSYTVVPLDAPVPIPIKVKREHLKVVKE